MKDILKLIVTLVIAAIPASIAILLWSWFISLVPATFAYAWLAKILITLGCIVVGGGATVWFTVIFAVMAFAILFN